MSENQDQQGQRAAEGGDEAVKQSPTQPPARDGGVVREDDQESTTPGVETDPEDQEDGRTPPPDDLSQDPAYEPQDESLKDIKGG
jgi:hypothetical protein